MAASPTQPSPAERLLEAASSLFALEGIRAVGVDRILERAGAHRASLYQAYGSKDGLIAAYLRRQDERDQAAYQQARAGVADPAAQVLLAFDLAAANAHARAFRGCLYLNAATEFPDSEHPSAAIIREHRRWLSAAWGQAALALGAGDPDGLVADLAILYDGGLAGSKLTRTTEPIERARALAAQLLDAARGR